MPVTIKVNGAVNSLVHKGSNGVSVATIPDVCKTPSPGGPVPIPYPNVSQSASLSKGTTTVKADGGMMIAIKGSEFSLSNGDNAGVAGGVKSSTFMKESTWILYSFDVKIEGENACRLTDKKFQNHENSADLGGELQPGLSVLGEPGDVVKCPNCGAAVTVNRIPATVERTLPKDRPPFELRPGETGISVFTEGLGLKGTKQVMRTNKLRSNGYEVVQTHACGQPEPQASNHFEIRAVRTDDGLFKKYMQRNQRMLSRLQG
jgi:hypothetical protein